LKFLALADGAIQRAYDKYSTELKAKYLEHKSGLDAEDKKIQLILQKKIIRLDFFVTFFINEKK